MPRTRVRRKTKLVTSSDKTMLTRLVNSVSEKMKQIKSIESEIKEEMIQVELLMASNGLQEHHAPKGDALYASPPGRATTVINKMDLYEMCEDEEVFIDCVSVIKKQAEKHFSGKELAAISTTIEAKPKDPILKITPK